MSTKPAFRDATPWLPIAVGPVLLFGLDLMRGQALFWGAPILQFTPWRTAAKQIVLSGNLPVWNPWLGMGAPLLANYQSALFYPPNWILLVTDVSWGQTLLVMLHLIWAGFGMAVLSRSLRLGTFAQAIAGLAYAMSGYLIARAGFLSINAAAAWLPWILYAAERVARAPGLRSIAILGLLMGLQWLSGHAQIAWYTVLLTAAWVLFRARSHSSSLKRAAIALVAASALAFAIAAVQLIPTLEYVLVSNRLGDLDVEFALNYSFWPWRVLGLIAPDLFGNPRNADFWGYGNYWEDAIYIGVLPFLLAIGAVFTKRIGRLKWFLLAISAFALLMSLGRNTPVFTFLFEYVPSFSSFQAPTRWNILLIACVSILAGLGAEHWQVAKGRKLYWLRLGTAGAGAVLVVAILVGRIGTTIEPTFPSSIALAGLWLGICGLLALLKTLPDRRGWIVAALGTVVIDLYLAGRGLNPTLPVELNTLPSKLSTEVSSDHRLFMSRDLEREVKFDVAFRFDSFQPQLDWRIVRGSGLPNTPSLDELTSANNFDPLLPARYVAWMEALERTTAAQRERLLPYMNVGWQAVGPPIAYQPVPEQPVRAWFVPSVEWVEQPNDAIRLATSLDFDPGSEAVLEGEPRLLVGGEGIVSSLHDESPNEVALTVEAPVGGWLILADTWYPGWATEIDGQPVQSYPANGVMRATWIPPGDHTVSYRYNPIVLPIGLSLTIIGLAALAYLRRR